MAALQLGSKCSHTYVHARVHDFFTEPRLAMNPDPYFKMGSNLIL